MNDNLNHFLIPNADGPDQPLKDYSLTSNTISAYFRNLDVNLIKHINDADAVFGCVAWLSHFNVLDALAKKEVSIVIQKEDFLRPDINIKDRGNFHRNLREKYNNLSCNIDRWETGTILNEMSYAGDPTIKPIRCVGNINKEKHPAFPRMHNKFMVFAKIIEIENTESPGHKERVIRPYAVWTGSFNFTKNAVASFENALVITDDKIVDAYYKEWAQITALSEDLDWFQDWCAPEWRIGT